MSGGVHGFPAELTSFVGRQGQVRGVARLLEQYRLVTVTGPGGAGKTRLAGQVARTVAGRFADGAWLAELAAAGDPVPLENRIRLLALGSSWRQAAWLYSLIRPFSMGFRRIRWTSRLAAVPRGTSRSQPGTRCAMP